MKTKAIRRFVSLALTLVMVLGMLPTTVWAAVAHDAPKWGEAMANAAGRTAEAVRVKLLHSANGPSRETSGGQNDSAHLWICNTGTGLATTQLYNAYGSVNNSAAGAVYDLASNTLSLTNYNGVGTFLEARAMGEDFTIRLAGSSELDVLLVYGAGYGGSLHIVGDGSLTVNGAGNAARFLNSDPQNPIYEDGLRLYAGGGSAKLTVSAASALTVRGYNNGEAIAVKNTTDASGGIDGNLSSGTVRRTSPRVGPVQAQPENPQTENPEYETTTFHFLCEKDSRLYGVQQFPTHYSIYELTKTETGYTYGARVATLTSEEAIAEAGYRIICEEGRYIYEVVDGTGAPLSVVSFTPTGAGRPAIRTDSLANGIVGVAYSAALSAEPSADGKAITWSASGLPDGLTLNGTTGAISGTPTAAGTYSVVVTASEADGGIASASFTILVRETVINTESLPNALQNAEYSAALSATGAVGGAITWSIASGGLPAGLTLIAATGVISGTPTAKGASTFTVTATEEGGGTAAKELTLTVASSVTVTYAPNGGTWSDSTTNDKKVVAAEGGTISLAEGPRREDFTFAGWKCTAPEASQACGYIYEAGCPFTVSESVTFTAQWERPLTVTYTGPVVLCWATLYGVSGEQKTTLWSGALTSSIQVDMLSLRGRSYDSLELVAPVDGSSTAIATYTPSGGNKVTQETGAVTLTRSLEYAVLNGVTVTGLTKGSDYTVGKIMHGTCSLSADYLPCLVSANGTYTVGLAGVKGSEKYGSYDWSVEYTGLALSDAGMLTIDPAAIAQTVAVSGTVTVDQGSGSSKPSGVIVTATQIVGGVARSVSAATKYENGTTKYTLHLIPGTEATFTASYQGQQLSVTDGATLTGSGVTNGRTHNLDALSNLLTVTITPGTAGMTDAEKALADSYLQNLVRKSSRSWDPDSTVTVKSGGKSWSEGISVTGISGTTRSCNLDFIETANTTLTVSANVPGLAATSGSVELTDSRAKVKFTPALIPGVVVTLSATRGADVFTAWYDGSGNYIGKSETFGLCSDRNAHGIPCPTGATGTFTVVLLPASYDGCVENLAYSALPAGAELTHWDTALTPDGVTKLSAFDLSAAASENAAFVTKPGSTLTASAQSFSSESDLIAFTGRIGLDDGCKNGRLIELYANMGNSVHDSASSSVPRWLVINGTSYLLPGTQSSGDYHIDLSAYNIPLPCDYTLYCSPGSVLWEMAVSLSADVTYNTGTNAYRQLIGRAVVEKPDAYITTLSSYVCDEQITVEGTAAANRSVTIYDNNVIVGTATADRYGDWAAIITLAGTDARYVTVHSIHSVGETGVMSDEITVFHQPGGAQLTGFTMSYTGDEGRKTVNVGDTYTTGSGGIRDVSFAVTVKNPEQLEVLTEGFNSKVTVKVYTNDGQIRFVPATEGPSGTFVATVGDLPALVSGAEAMMLPITKTNPVTDGGLTIDEGTVEYVHDLLGQVLDQYNRDNHTAYTGFSDIWVNSTPGELAFMQDGSGNVTVTAGTASPSQLADVKAKMDETNASLAGSGMTIEGAAVQTQNGYDDNSGVAATVRAMAAQNRTVSGTASLITEQCFFSELQTLLYDFRKTLGLGAEVSMQSGSFDLSDAAAADGDAFLVLSLSGSGYDISVAYIASTDSRFYMRSITATFHDSFTGFPAGFAAATSRDGAFTVQQSLVLAREKPMTPYERAQLEAQQEALKNSWITKFINNCRTEDGYGMLHLELVIGLFQHVLASTVGAALTVVDGFNTLNHMSETCQNRYRELRKFRDDLDELKQHPCYQVMKPTRRSICEGLYQKYVDEADMCSTIQALTGMAVMVCISTSIVSAAVTVTGCLPASAVSLVSGSAGYFIGNYGQIWADNLFTKASDAYQNCWMITAQFIRITAQEYEGDDCKGEKKKKKDGINGKTIMGNVFDPSGIVYEGVLENPVEGATVMLYYAADGSGNIPTDGSGEKNTAGAAANATQLKTASGVRSLTPDDPVQTTGAVGLYQWFVPEGLWFVTAEKGGLTGNSNGDKAATVSKSVGIATALLPVLPPQLDVNIPLVDNAVPYVTGVQYTTDGIYVTFSKYMVDTGGGTDSALTGSNYTLMNDTTPITITGVSAVEQGSTPANRGTPTTTYTRTVKLTTSEPLTAGTNVTLTVAPWVTSYAGVPMGTAYSSGGTARAPQQLAAPVFSGAKSTGEAFSGPTVTALMNRGSALTISAEDSAAIYYTTDGTEPEVAENGTPSGTTKRYTGPIAVSGSMTVKAIAVKLGYITSGAATATITQRAVGTLSDGTPVSANTSPSSNPSQNGSGGSGGGSSTSTVPVTGSAGSVDLGVKVSNGTAQLDSLSDADVAKLVGTDGGNANVVMDLSNLGDKVNTVSLPAASVTKLSNALEAHEGNDSLTIKTANGTVKLNENALSAAANAGSTGDVALTIKNVGANTLSTSERAALGGGEAEAVYTLGLTSNGRDVGTLGGGFAAAELPFTAGAEKDALGYRVYRLNDDGTATLVPSAVHDGVVTVRSDRLAKLAVVYEPLTERFDDVSAGAYYSDAVLWALANGITNGMGDGRFAPDEPCSRVQIVTFLWRAAGCPKPKHATSGFSDVPDDAWYSEAVAWAVENGITNGMGDGRFGVDEACTRAQVMTMLYRMDGGEAAASAAFTDVASGQWYSAAIAWAAANGITNGVGDGRFGVDEPCTRGQIVTMLYRWFTK